jgi:hypothetical protein
MSLTNHQIAQRVDSEAEAIHFRFEQLKEKNKSGKLTNRELANLQRAVLKELRAWKAAHALSSRNTGGRSNY